MSLAALPTALQGLFPLVPIVLALQGLREYAATPTDPLWEPQIGTANRKRKKELLRRKKRSDEMQFFFAP